LKKGRAFEQLTKDLKPPVQALMGVMAVAEFLGVAPHTVTRMAQRDELDVADGKMLADSVWKQRLAWRRQWIRDGNTLSSAAVARRSLRSA
jgi:hypothetical protein